MLIFRAFAGLGNRLLTILTLKCNNYLLLLLIERRGTARVLHINMLY